MENPSLKSLDSNNPQSSRLEGIQDHSYPPQDWPTNKDHSKSKVCNGLQGHKRTQSNFKATKPLSHCSRLHLQENSEQQRHAWLDSKEHWWPSDVCEKLHGQAGRFSDNVLWTAKTKTDFLILKHYKTRSIAKTMHSRIRPLSHLWSMVVVVSRFGTVLPHLGQESLVLLTENLFLNICQ